MENKIIYLDNNATTRVDDEAAAAMMPFLTGRYGNPSSIHTFGGSVMAEVEKARLNVAELLNATGRDREGSASEIIFTSCGTESDNAAIAAAVSLLPERKKIVSTVVEHPAVLNTLDVYRRKGFAIKLLPVDGKGRISLDELKSEVDENTALVSIMAANNEIGNVYPVKEAADIAHASGALFHTDAVQAAGKLPIDLSDGKIDFLSISGHKLHAPKGIGVLYVRRGLRFTPFIVGGHQERGRRAGTENVPSIVALGRAAELASQNLREERVRLTALRDRLEKGVLETIPCIRVNGDLENRLPNTSSISFEFIEGEAILLMLNMFGICASSGSACTTGSLEPSHVLMAMKLPYTAAHGTIRFSLSKYNTAEEIDFVLEKLPPVIARLRELSPYWEKRSK